MDSAINALVHRRMGFLLASQSGRFVALTVREGWRLSQVHTHPQSAAPLGLMLAVAGPFGRSPPLPAAVCFPTPDRGKADPEQSEAQLMMGARGAPASHSPAAPSPVTCGYCLCPRWKWGRMSTNGSLQLPLRLHYITAGSG
ncbi:hypothetical protein NDU88_001415 [Pleurodeles waltl]|uniref:Uncharacterized protein n=1 Tax=Pleurodeles waltl TaxID=8319 RepID=A0AAV7SC78_PLEWA|nr:hypothetical protein NDU88_001415 [Pleurodeles waltl]